MNVHLRRGILITLAVVACTLTSVATYKYFRWKRFAVVHEGKIYRSGQLEPRHLQAAIEKLNLKTVICLNKDAASWESDLCTKADVSFHSFEMPSSGLGDKDDFATVLQLIADPARQPILVHCRAGVARTGASIALFRMLNEGWSFDEAIAELRTFERKGRCEQSLQDHIASTYKYISAHRLAGEQTASNPAQVQVR